MKKSYTFHFLVLFLLFVGTSFGQQIGVYSNYLLNDYYYNPAVAGSKNVHAANIAYRNSWIGFESAPKSFALNLNGSYKNRSKAGYGATLINERSGLISKTGFYANYAQHLKLGKTIKLAAGLQFGYLQYNLKLYDAILADQNDLILSGNTLSNRALDMSGGINLYNEKFFVRAAVSQILGKNLRFTSLNNSLVKQYTMSAGYNFLTKNKKLEIQPSVMVRIVAPVPVAISSMLKFTFSQKFYVAGVFRNDDAFGLALGVTLKERITIGYCFDYNYSGLKNFQTGSHEIGLSFVLTKAKPELDKEDDNLNKSILDELKKREEEQKKQN